MLWKNLLNGSQTYITVKNKVDEIYEAIVNYENNEFIALLGGYSGCLLFHYYYYRFTKKKEHLLVLQKKCKTILDDFINKPDISYCSGYSGICWLIRFLKNEDIIEIIDTKKYFFEIDNLIHQGLLYYLQQNNYDYLHGGLGMVYYFITQGNENGDSVLQEFLSALDSNKINVDGSVKWLSNIYVKPYEKTLAYNLGMAHGMGSIIGLLLKLIECQKHDIFAKELLLKIILFYKNNKNPSTYRSVFSPWIIPDNDEKIESRLAWCYGDLGISQILYKAGVLLNDVELTKLALNSLFKSSYRKNKILDNVDDACICHGTSGICHIYNRMYQQTNMSIFKDLAIYWLDETLKMGQKSEQFAGFQFMHTGNDILNFSLLNGLSGVGLSLLSMIDSTEPKWDECIMLS
jgi:hypothetical protein